MTPSIAGRSFAGRSRSEIANSMEEEQRNRLREFFGQGLRGALAATHTFRLPEGLTAQTLEQYHEVARQMIQEERDPNVCAMRSVVLGGKGPQPIRRPVNDG